jgi:tetratricopeptide (TPR) repeat protein
MALILLLTAASAAAFVRSNKQQPHLSVAASVTTEQTADQILARFPAPSESTATGKLMIVTMNRVRGSSEDATAWTDLGDLLAQEYRNSGDTAYYSHAEAAYRRALKLDPRKVDAMTGLAWVFGGRHMFLESTEWARRALDIEPDNRAAYGISGDAALEQGDYELALDHYRRMTELRPDLASWSRGAHLLWMTGSVSRAIALMQMAIRSGAPFAENTAWCRARLAMMFFHDGALVPASQTIEAALAGAPNNTQVLLAAGRIAAARGDLAGAERYYQTMLKGGPNLEALVALCDLSMARGDKAAAEEFYAKVEALHSANVAAGVHDHTTIAKFYADHDRHLAQALVLAEQHKLTRNVQEADILAWVYFKNGDRARAVEFMKLALSQNTPDPDMQFHAGMIAAQAGDRVSAQKHLQAALAMNPRFHPVFADVAAKTLNELGGHSTAGNSVRSSAENQ